ncbi:MAG TPA: hypothetical protein VFB63_21555, partial [Bryobacteraceae bacterium]|nr:hypothetical protein [Bryobacteraceae bacterium]
RPWPLAGSENKITPQEAQNVRAFVLYVQVRVSPETTFTDAFGKRARATEGEPADVRQSSQWQ